MISASPGIIILTAKVPPDPSNIGEYSCLLAAALRALGYSVQVWSLRSPRVDGACAPSRSFARYRTDLQRVFRVVRAAKQMPGAVVLWQHNPFMYAWKGLPLATSVLPVSLRFFARCRVAAIFHEIAVDPLQEVSMNSPYDARNWVWTVWHRLALWLTMLGCTAAIATNTRRAAFLHRFIRRYMPWRTRQVRIAAIPVGSIIPTPSETCVGQYRSPIVRIGAFRASLPAPQDAFAQDLIDRLRLRAPAVQFVLFGCDADANSAAALDEQPGIRRIRYLPSGAVAELMTQLDIFVALPEDGASGRRTALAMAFGFGLCVISTQGICTDDRIFRHGENCLLVPAEDRDQLLAALERCIADSALRSRMGAAARDAFQTFMSWPSIARNVVETSGL